MKKTVAIGALAYAGAGLAVAMWSASRGAAGKPHFQGHRGSSAPVGLAEAVVLWPWAAFVNVTAK